MARSMQRVLAVAVLLLTGVVSLLAQAPQGKAQPAAPPKMEAAPSGAPVVVRGETLFLVQRLGSFSAEERAQAIATRARHLSRDARVESSSFSVVKGEGSIDVVAADMVVMSVTPADAKAAGMTEEQFAELCVRRLAEAVTGLRYDYNLKTLGWSGLYALLATGALLLLLRLFRYLFRGAYIRVRRATGLTAVKIQNVELLSARRISELLLNAMRLLRFLLTAVLVYVYLTVVLDLFPWTRGYAAVLVSYVTDPLQRVGLAMVRYLPDLFFIAVIVTVAVYVTKFVKMLFEEIERGNIEWEGFYPDWAKPTYEIVRFCIIVLTAVVIFPYLPGSQSPAFQGISIFLGLLLSLGSTSSVANVVAGVILTYMRAFKVGDRVKIADTIGDVVEKSLLVTRVRTIKNEDITIANSMVLGAHIINFSASSQDRGLILHTTVTIGYDAPWRKVHELLLAAAGATEGLLAEPAPFVLQTKLDDFYIHYQINAYTDRPGEMAVIYSALHQNIQEKFNEAGVEIMSPHYAALRDGNTMALPADYLGGNYRAPGFRIEEK